MWCIDKFPGSPRNLYIKLGKPCGAIGKELENGWGLTEINIPLVLLPSIKEGRFVKECTAWRYGLSIIMGTGFQWQFKESLEDISTISGCSHPGFKHNLVKVTIWYSPAPSKTPWLQHISMWYFTCWGRSSITFRHLKVLWQSNMKFPGGGMFVGVGFPGSEVTSWPCCAGLAALYSQHILQGFTRRVRPPFKTLLSYICLLFCSSLEVYLWRCGQSDPASPEPHLYRPRPALAPRPGSPPLRWLAWRWIAFTSGSGSYHHRARGAGGPSFTKPYTRPQPAQPEKNPNALYPTFDNAICPRSQSMIDNVLTRGEEPNLWLPG